MLNTSVKIGHKVKDGYKFYGPAIKKPNIKVNFFFTNEYMDPINVGKGEVIIELILAKLVYFNYTCLIATMLGKQ